MNTSRIVIHAFSFLCIWILIIQLTACINCKSKLDPHPIADDELSRMGNLGNDTLLFLYNNHDTLTFNGLGLYKATTDEGAQYGDCITGDSYQRAYVNYAADSAGGKKVHLRIVYSNYDKDYRYDVLGLLPFARSDFYNMFAMQVQGKTYYQVSKTLNHSFRDSTTDILYTDLQYGIVKIINGTNGAVYERIMK